MKEAAFIRQNGGKWQEFEKILEEGTYAEPDRLADLFIHITDDLSYSRTQYPESDTTQYLNNLASRVHQEIYKNKREDRNRIWRFWKQELPLLFYDIRKPLFYSFLIFVIAIVIGAVSALNDDTFVRLILGDQYVDMTLENIKKGNPLAVYGNAGEADMFFSITLNNIMVSFKVFVLGIVASIGSGFMLFYNGIMVGSFFTFLAREGFMARSFLIVMLHGTLELSAIVIAGAGGLVMGNSLLFPGTYSRLESFKRGAVKGLKVVIGLVPVFIMAGFIESFITRYTTMHWAVNLTIIFLSATFIIFYFIYYPAKLHRNVSDHRITRHA